MAIIRTVLLGIVCVVILAYFFCHVYNNLNCECYMDRADFYPGCNKHIVAEDYRMVRRWNDGR